MYKKVLVTLDGSKISECVLPHAHTLREGFPNCEMVLLRVVLGAPGKPPESISPEQWIISPEQWKATEDLFKTDAEDYLKKVSDRIPGRVPVQSKVLVGKIEDVILAYVDTENVDLILMATHGRSGVKRWAMGSVAEKILRSSKVPVMLIRAAYH